MLEVSKGIYVGNQGDGDYSWKRKDEWAIVYCAKNPWHRNFVGYVGNGCPKDHKEYLYAIRDNSIALNCVDVDTPNYFSIEMIKMAIAFAVSHEDRKILFCCNQGISRSPSVAMLYLAIINKIPRESFLEAEKVFKKLYPFYNPRNGIREHLKTNWSKYMEVDII